MEFGGKAGDGWDYHDEEFTERYAESESAFRASGYVLCCHCRERLPFAPDGGAR